MKTYFIPENTKVFGLVVPNFPNGIGDAFDKLVSMLPKGDARPYYGISECTNNTVVYKAAALQTFEGEGAKYGCETYMLEGGTYLAGQITGWMQKTASIKSMFEKMLQDERADDLKPCIEIYKNDDEMLCLIRMKPLAALAHSVANTFHELAIQLSLISKEDINTVPFEGSWTAGQLAQHLILSNGGFLDMMNGPAKETKRAPGELIPSIKSVFLNFDTKMQSPPFILPEMKQYDKAELLAALDGINKGMTALVHNEDLSKTCTSFEIPFFGFLTRLEALHFSMYHTQRHTHQLKNMYERLTSQAPVAM